jgi:phage shock protein PspC (stress-responsive transcriptional regulator)
MMQTTIKLLRRSKKDAMIGGVAASLGNYAGISPTVIRLGWLVFTLLGGAGLLAYLIAWTIIPDEDDRRTIVPLLLLALGILLPFVLMLLWLVPVTVTTTR